MSYFVFLGIFLLVPIAVLAYLDYNDRRRRRPLRPAAAGRSPYGLIGLLVAIAVIWTTPWDNYLVATRVWWYDPALVSGIVLGWVPLEEYCFFVLQPIMTGLLVVVLARRLPAAAPLAPRSARQLRQVSTAAAVAVAVGMWLPLILGVRPLTYLALELVWALPPIALQLAFGADLLWQQRRLVGVAIAGPTLYLGCADALAISAGTWTIDPEQSLVTLKLFGVLPLEEAVFFLLTNVLVVFGLVLGMARDSQPRLPAATRPFFDRVAPPAVA